VGNISKLAAIGLFQEYGLEGLPARVYPASSRPGLTELTRDFPGTPLFMLRTGSDVEERNLPRKAGVALADVPAWAAELPPHLHL
jgi:hypothetical protein